MTEHETNRFWRMVRVSEPTLCWLWEGAKDRHGYGTMKIARKTTRAHRISILVNGGTLQDGLVVDHTCRNRACVNPRHLRMVSNAENVLTGEGPTARHALKTHCPQGHPYSGENLVRRPNGGRGCRECRSEYQRRRRAGTADAERTSHAE